MICHPLPPPAPPVRPDDIRRCAYFLWLEAGRPPGRDLEFWTAAREWLHYAPRHGGPGPGKKCAQEAKMRGAPRPAFD